MRTTSCTVTRVGPHGAEVFEDAVAVEEPLEILAAWSGDDGEPREKLITITMRTPGDDFDLAAGFLLSEQLIPSRADIESLRHWASPNRVRVALRAGARIDTARIGRNFLTTSACGVCGKTSIDSLNVPPLPPTAPLPHSVITALPRLLSQAQSAFRETGGAHGAAIVDREGHLLCVREDVGRHNAVDKVIGAFERDTFTDVSLVVSSRASFEIVQKAIVRGFASLVSIGAPSSLAIDLARKFNLTLIGFVREGRFNDYTSAINPA